VSKGRRCIKNVLEINDMENKKEDVLDGGVSRWHGSISRNLIK